MAGLAQLGVSGRGRRRRQGVRLKGRLGFFTLVFLYGALELACSYNLIVQGSLLGALVAWPLTVLSARKLAAPRLLRWGAQELLSVLRSIHTLVFGLVLVGIVGLGPTAGILAIALHSTGTYGISFA